MATRPVRSRQAAASADYRLTPGDKLRVEVYKDAQLSQSLQIRPDGKVTLPLLGDIVAIDLTPIQLRDRIATGLKEYVTNPVVTVIVVEASPLMIYVMGEVMQPGSIPMRGQMTVLQALAMAGGFREFAEHQGHPHPAEGCRRVEDGRDHPFQLQRRHQRQRDADVPVARRHGRRAVTGRVRPCP